MSKKGIVLSNIQKIIPAKYNLEMYGKFVIKTRSFTDKKPLYKIILCMYWEVFYYLEALKMKFDMLL